MREVIARFSGRSTHRLARRSLVSLIAALGSVAAAAVPASASVGGHSFSTTFGGSGASALSSPAGVAIDNSTGDVYVTDEANHRVEKFDSAGNFLLMFGKNVNSGTGNPDVCTSAGAPTDVCQAGTSTTSPGGFVMPTWVAVDNSNGASKGDVYVGDSEYEAPVQKFDSSGNLITSWAEGGQLFDGIYPIEEVSGIAVGPHGNLYVLGPYLYTYKYNQDGTYEEAREEGFSSIPLHFGPAPGATIDSHENFYYGFYADEGVLKFAAFQAGPPEEHIKLGEVTAPETSTTGMAADTFGNDELYVDNHGTQIDAYSESCNNACPKTQTFGSGHLTEGKGVAINPTTHVVYVADAATGTVVVFTPIVLADVKPKPTSDVGPASLTLNAIADPAGGPEVTECMFEYGTAAGSYGLGTVPCQTEAPTALPYSTATPVHGELSGLALHTVYHYRLVLGTANGPTDGPDQTAEAQPNPPLIHGTSSSNVSPTQATLEAQINPDLGPTIYRFQYGITNTYGQQTYPSSSIGEDEVDHLVSAEVPGLTPNTTYHFRVVATNIGGTVFGPDRLFTTPAPPTILQASSSAVGRAGATLEAQVNPDLLSTTFHFEYGITTAYGTSSAESASIGSDDLTHSVSTVISGLDPGTTYHYRVVASNLAGSVSSVDETFATQSAAVEEPPITKPKPCKPGFVKKQGKCMKKKRHRKRGHRHA